MLNSLVLFTTILGVQYSMEEVRGVTSIGVGKKNLSEETLGLGNVGVPSSFVASQWLEEKAGW